MRLLHYLEIENFKTFGDKQRIDLEHPAVIIGPNNCGKTSVIQALALWSQAVKTWYEARKSSSAKKKAGRADQPVKHRRCASAADPFLLARHKSQNGQ